MLNIPPGYYEAAFKHTLDGSLHTAVTTCGFQYGGIDIQTDLPVLYLGWYSLVDEMCDVWHFDSLSVRSGEGTIYEHIGPLRIGGKALKPATANISWILRKITATPGRRGRGRMFVPGVAEEDVDANGRVAPSTLARLQNALNLTTQEWAAAHWALRLFHTKGSLPSDTPTPLTDIKWHEFCGLQRDRLPRRA